MREKEFKEWLERKYPSNVVKNVVSRCKKVESTYKKDLEYFFKLDGCRTIIKELTYSAYDERMNDVPEHPIPIGGNIRTNSASYKQGVKLYVEFCQTQNKNFSQVVKITGTPKKLTNIHCQDTTKLMLRQDDKLFKNIKELDNHFVEGVVGSSEDSEDVNNCKSLALTYFNNFEGEWYIRDEEEQDTYIKISETESSRSKNASKFFEELFERNELEIREILSESWESNVESIDDYPYVSEDEKWLREKDENEIMRNFTGGY